MRCPVIVGRDAELADLAQLVERAAAGYGSCVIVSGEAGVGKTRLATGAATQARNRGHVTLLGRASPTDRSSPLRPVAGALLGALRDRPPPEDPGLAPYLPALGSLVPHWAEADRALAAVPPTPVVLAEAVLRVLRWLATCGERPVAAVLVLEDMHWVDRETLAVVEYLADHVTEVPVAVLLTLRSDEPGTADIETTFRADTAISLQPLAARQVAAMAAACLGVPIAPSELVETLSRAGGLPLLVEDLISVDGHPGPLRYAEIVSRRLVGLDPAARAVLDAAAVLGNEVDPDLLGPITGLPREQLSTATAALTASALLAPHDSLLRFRHALVREFVLAALPAATRRAVSLAAATVLDGLESERVAISGRLGELWATGGEPREAVEALRRASTGARVTGATGTAEALLRRALAIAPTDMVGPLRLELLELLAVSGQVEKLATVGAQALDELAHDPRLTAAVHLLLARAAVAAGAPQQAQPHLDAVAAIGELSPRQNAQLRIVQAGAVMGGRASDRLTSTGHLAGQAVAFAELAGDAELTCEALELLATAVRIKDLTTAADTLRRELGVAERAGLVLWRLRALNELGTVESLRDARPDRLERALELALRIGAVDTAASVAINLAAAHAMVGAIEPALAAAELAQQLAAPLGATGAVAAAMGVEGVTRGLAGRRVDMERLVRRALELSPDDADLAAFTWAAGHGLSALLHEKRADAIDAFRRARTLATPIRTLDAAIGPLLLVRAVQSEDVLAAVESEQASSTAGARWSAAWLGYARAAALGAAGDPVAAESAFETAERAADRYPLFRAIAVRLVAEAGLQHGFGEPVGWLRGAEAELVGRGLHRIASACRGLLAKAGAPSTRRRGEDTALPPELLRLGVTAREAEVLELVGEHLSNKDIAAQLYLSPRTVEKHVASLLLKTGSSDRAALTRLARYG